MDFSDMKKFKEGNDAVSPVIGAILMVGMTVIMIAAVAISVMGFALPENAPQVKIVIAEAKGDFPDQLDKNVVVLKHKGGDALFRNHTKIIITGKGIAYTGVGGLTGPAKDIRVTYADLSGNNYNGTGSNLGEIVKGITWDAGETITLYGSDGTVSQGNTVDSKWMLEAGSEVRVTIIDLSTNEAMTTSIITVNQA